MTDMHREAFERLIAAASNVLAADNWWKRNSDSPKSALNHYESACADLRAALRYRDEQEKGE